MLPTSRLQYPVPCVQSAHLPFVVGVVGLLLPTVVGTFVFPAQVGRGVVVVVTVVAAGWGGVGGPGGWGPGGVIGDGGEGGCPSLQTNLPPPLQPFV